MPRKRKRKKNYCNATYLSFDLFQFRIQRGEKKKIFTSLAYLFIIISTQKIKPVGKIYSFNHLVICQIDMPSIFHFFFINSKVNHFHCIHSIY